MRLNKRSLHAALGLTASFALTTGCGQTAFVASGSGGANSAEDVSDPAGQCTVNYVDYNLNTSIMSYEFVSKEGGTFGFDLGSGFFQALGASVDVSSSQINLSMSVADVYNPNSPFLNTLGNAQGSDVGLTGNIGFSQIGLGFNYYSETPVSQLTQNGLANTFNSLEKLMATYEQSVAWHTRVLQLASGSSDTVIVQAGIVAGLRVGDTFNLTNTVHDWAGTPCASQHLGERRLTSTPLATAVVTSVDSYTAELQIQSPGITNNMIQPGALVEIANLPKKSGDPSKGRVLARSVALKSLTSGTLQIGTDTQVDIAGYARQQVPAVISPSQTSNRYYLVNQ